MIILTLLCRFQCVQMPNKVLESVSIIDTPGILTAAKRKLSRGDRISFFIVRKSLSVSIFFFLTFNRQLKVGKEDFLVREMSNYML